MAANQTDADYSSLLPYLLTLLQAPGYDIGSLTPGKDGKTPTPPDPSKVDLGKIPDATINSVMDMFAVNPSLAYESSGRYGPQQSKDNRELLGQIIKDPSMLNNMMIGGGNVGNQTNTPTPEYGVYTNSGGPSVNTQGGGFSLGQLLSFLGPLLQGLRSSPSQQQANAPQLPAAATNPQPTPAPTNLPTYKPVSGQTFSPSAFSPANSAMGVTQAPSAANLTGRAPAVLNPQNAIQQQINANATPLTASTNADLSHLLPLLNSQSPVPGMAGNTSTNPIMQAIQSAPLGRMLMGNQNAAPATTPFSTQMPSGTPIQGPNGPVWNAGGGMTTAPTVGPNVVGTPGNYTTTPSAGTFQTGQGAGGTGAGGGPSAGQISNALGGIISGIGKALTPGVPPPVTPPPLPVAPQVVMPTMSPTGSAPGIAQAPGSLPSLGGGAYSFPMMS